MEPPFLAWRDTFAVGYEELDLEHRRLVEIINVIHAAECTSQTPDQLRQLLHALNVAAIEHFKHENSVLRDIGEGAVFGPAGRSDFPETMSEALIIEHCAEHANALIELEKMISAAFPGNASAGHGLSESLMHWFIEHANKHDAHLKKFFAH